MTNSYICSDCVSEKHLKKLIETSQLFEDCDFCKTKTIVFDYESDDFYYLLKALIRYHYNEWDYNHHWGGESLYKLMEDDEILFNKSNFDNPQDIEKLIELIENFDAYEDYDKGISLYAGYDEEGNQNMLLRALKNEMDSELSQIIKKLQTQNYFELEDSIIKQLNKFVANASIVIKENEKFYRARIGYKSKEFKYLADYMEGDYFYTPYSGNEISSPPPLKSQSGRLNRTGVSFLYCSTNMNTAIAEVRPHPGDRVSTGCFLTKEKLSIFNLAKEYLLDYYKTDKLLDEYFIYINSICGLFLKTIPPSEKENYSITQLIADSIRKIGFDGILFPSSVGNGENLVVFNSNKMKYKAEGKSIVVVKKVTYEYI